MRVDIVTIFPEYFAPLDVSLLGKARRRGSIDVRVHNLRDWTHDRHRTVDDEPYGGGPGMVMTPQPWGEALDAIAASGAESAGEGYGAPRLVVPTPSGCPFDQACAVSYSAQPWLILACGRYEGIDERFVEWARERMPADEVSVGDYVLAGGEAAALVIVEAVARLLPGVLGNAASVTDDSFAPGAMAGLVEGPVYTKPAAWRGREVPEVVRSGDHAAIARWRRDEALRRTVANRPELAARMDPRRLDQRDRQVLRTAGFPVGGEGMAN